MNSWMFREEGKTTNAYSNGIKGNPCRQRQNGSTLNAHASRLLGVSGMAGGERV